MLLRLAGISGACAGLLLTACAAPINNRLPNMPVFNTGASAVIIPPGQAGPAMTGSYPPGYYPPGAAQGAAGAAPPGAPGAAPQGALVPAPAGAGSDMTMLGGATTIDTRTLRNGRDPLWDYPLLWPVAAVVWPFEKLNQALTTSTQSNNGSYTQNGSPALAPTAAPALNAIPQKQQIEAAHEQAQIDEMKRELAARQSGGGAPQASATATDSAQPSLSIADELAALRTRASNPPSSDGGAPAPGASPGPDVAGSGWTTIKTEDRDHDGRPDRWIQQLNGRKRELLDDDHDGRPEKTIYYEPGSDKIARIEEDTNGDGQPDAWTIYKDGKILVRRADTNGDGEIDSWTFYRDGQVVRQEQDTDGDGVRDRIDYYENGKLVRRSEDRDGDGHPERITLFDAKGNPIEVDEDKNGDGKIDVRSYYTGGKLVRRELLDESQAVQ